MECQTKKMGASFYPKEYIQPTVREVFKDLTDEPSNSKDFKSTTVSCCREKLEKGEFDLEENCYQKKYRVMGTGPPKKALKVQYGLFDYFIDIRYSLKGQLPQHILLFKAKQLYEEYCVLKAEAGEVPEKLKTTRKWCKDYHISLQYPNKTNFYNSRSLKEKNKWWKAKYKVDPPILSADQMPLHHNESGSQKSLNFSGSNQSCFAKENHHLTKERSTVMTIASLFNAIKTPPLEFVFKGKGI